jgi:hypothetical protein
MIRALRANGLSQMDIERITGIPQPRISRWEAGDVPDNVNDGLVLARLYASRVAGAVPPTTTEGN